MAEDIQVGPGMYVKLGLDTSGMLGGVGGVAIVLNQTLGLFSKFEGAAQQFVDLAINAGKFGKEIKDNARDLGLSTKEFQQWTHAAIAAGSSAEEITGSIRMMSVRMKEASDPTSEMGKTLHALGVNVLDSSGKMRSMNDVLLDIFPALNALPEGFNRNQVAMTLFGRGFTNIADLASLSREQLQQLIDQAPVFSDEKVAKLDAFNTKMALLNEKMERNKVLVGEELIGSFTTWGNLIDTSMQKGRPLFIFFEKLNWLLELSAEGFTYTGSRLEAFYSLLSPYSPGFMDLKEFENQLTAIDVTIGVMRNRFAHPEDFEIDLDQATKEFDALGDAAGTSAEKVRDAQRTLEDLNQSIIDTKLSSEGTELELEDLWTEYYKNRDERRLTAAQADPETSGGQKYVTRVKELDEEQEDIVHKINLANQRLAKNKVSMLRDNQDLVSTMLEGDQKIVDSMQVRVDLTTTKYAELDQIESTHWQTVTDLARISYDAIIGYMVEAVNFAGTHPIIQNVILMTDKGPNWTPPAFTPISAESLSPPDFSKAIRTPGVTPEKASSTAGKSTTINFTQYNTGVETDADGMNKALGKLANLTGAGG